MKIIYSKNNQNKENQDKSKPKEENALDEGEETEIISDETVQEIIEEDNSDEISDDEKVKMVLSNIIIKSNKENKSENNSETQLVSSSDTDDFSDISLDNYPSVEISDETEERIDQLQTVIQSLESKINQNISKYKHDQSYKVDYSKELNSQQLSAVVNIKGPVLVIAGAGSGKTRVIVHRLSYLLENGINPQDILLLTFTRKAAKEMLSRINELLQDSRSSNITGGTFHAFSNFILRKYANFIGISPKFTIIDASDSNDTIDLIRSELKFHKNKKAFLKKRRLQEIISSARNRNISIKEVIENDFSGLIKYIQDVELIYSAYTQYKKSCNIFDYDDLMEVLRDHLRDNKVFRQRVRQQFKYVMVDEFQDTNVVQKEIVDLISWKHKNLMVVGDDAQSIYSFRGANFENILRFPETYPECIIIKIEQNYRSNQTILNFTNSIIANAKIGYKKSLFSENNNEHYPIIRKLENQEQEAIFIVDKILELRERGIPLKDIAILNRADWHNRYIQAELMKRNIDYVVIGGIRFYERRHVKDIICYLRVIQNPTDAVAWHRILKHIEGVGEVTAGQIIRNILNKEDGIVFQNFEKRKFFNKLNELGNLLNELNNPAISIPSKIERLKEYYEPYLASYESEFQVRLLDLDILVEMSSKYTDLAEFLSDFALDPPSKNRGGELVPTIDESEEKPLTISTVHSAKGLEWYCVFVPHALDGLFPSKRSLNTIEEIEEERRLFYVACSRAKENLFITMPSYVASWDSFFYYPSRFLLEIDKNHFKYLKIDS